MKSVTRFCISSRCRRPAEPPDASGKNTAVTFFCRCYYTEDTIKTTKTDDRRTSMVFNPFLRRLVTKRTDPEKPPPLASCPVRIFPQDMAYLMHRDSGTAPMAKTRETSHLEVPL
ncbi:unnamed protein product, partial [Ectocarpus sp. 4 AP-2014]